MSVSPSCNPRSGELRMQKLNSHLVRTQSLNVLPFTPGVGQYIAIHATLTARDFFLAYFYPSSPFTCIFSAADAEIKVPSGENTELKRSPFKAWSRLAYSHTCYAYCQGFLPCLLLPFRSMHLHFFQNLSRLFLCWLWLTQGSCVGPQNKIGHPAGCRFPCLVPAEYK